MSTFDWYALNHTFRISYATTRVVSKILNFTVINRSIMPIFFSDSEIKKYAHMFRHEDYYPIYNQVETSFPKFAYETV